MAEGSITIDVLASTDKFDKQIIALEKKMKKEEDKKITLDVKMKAQTDELDDARHKYKELIKDHKELVKLQDMPHKTVGQITRIQELENQYGSIEKLNEKIEQAYIKQEKARMKVQDIQRQYQALNNEVEEYKAKIDGIQLQKHQADIDNVKNSLSQTGGKIQNIIGQIGRWALAIVGIRAIYSGIRTAVSEISQVNEGLAGQIEAVRLSLASALAPVVQFIVDLITKAVALLGYVLKSLFGIDIFARASAMSLKKATGSASKLRKQLAGFDEMNVLNEDGTSGIAGGLANTLDALKDMNSLGESVFRNIRNWFLGSDKDDFWGIWNDNMQHIKDYVDLIKRTFEPVAKWINDNVWEPIKQNFGVVIEKLKPLIEPFKKAWTELVENHLKPLWDGFVSYIKPNVVEPILEFFKPMGREIHNFLVPYANKIIDLINNLFGVFGVNLEHWEYETEETFDNVEETIENSMENSEENSNEMTETMTDNLDEIGDNIDELNGKEVDIQTDTTEINEAKDGLEGLLEKLGEIVSRPWEIVTTFTAKVGSSVSNIFSGLRERFSEWGLHLPFMATGGIVNMPNTGTFVGGAMAGESGHEGVIPLTDQQAMAELGREIGRWITVNANITNTMNGRVISRELKNIQNEQDFAYNM